MARRRWIVVGAIGLVLLVAGRLAVRTALEGAFEPGPTEGPFAADGLCPTFQPRYPSCEVRFGNSGLSVLSSFYETFVGEGPFEIDAFDVDTLDPAVDGAPRFVITAQSNRGPITSRITADRLVRLGQEREDGEVNRTHQSAFCDSGRIYEHQVGYAGGEAYVQALEFWTADGALRFRLFQGGSPVADVACAPEDGTAAMRAE
jgi:hypothetical protein